MSAAPNHQAELQAILVMRDALEAAGLCGPDGSEEDDGRESALRILEALASRDVVLFPLRREAPTPAASLAPDPPKLAHHLSTGLARLRARAPDLAPFKPAGLFRRLRTGPTSR